MEDALLGASATAVIALVTPVHSTSTGSRRRSLCQHHRPRCPSGLHRQSPPPEAAPRYPMGNCQASPDYGAEGQFCRNFWFRNPRPPMGGGPC